MLKCCFPERAGIEVEVAVESVVAVGAGAAVGVEPGAAVGVEPGAGPVPGAGPGAEPAAGPAVGPAAGPAAVPAFGFVVVRVPETVELECLDMAAVRECSAEVNWTKFCHFLADQFAH